MIKLWADSLWQMFRHLLIIVSQTSTHQSARISTMPRRSAAFPPTPYKRGCVIQHGTASAFLFIEHPILSHIKLLWPSPILHFSHPSSAFESKNALFSSHLPAMATKAYELEVADQDKEPQQSAKDVQASDLESQSHAEVDVRKDGVLGCLISFHSKGPSDSLMPVSSAADIRKRRILSIALSIFLAGFIGLPLRLISWVHTYNSPYMRLADDTISHTILGVACYIHFRMASLTERPNPDNPRRTDWLGICAFGDLFNFVIALLWLWQFGWTNPWFRRNMAFLRILDRLLCPFWDLVEGKRFLITTGTMLLLMYFQPSF